MSRRSEIRKLAMEMTERFPPLRIEAELLELTEELHNFIIELVLNAELDYHL